MLTRHVSATLPQSVWPVRLADRVLILCKLESEIEDHRLCERQERSMLRVDAMTSCDSSPPI